MRSSRRLFQNKEPPSTFSVRQVVDPFFTLYHQTGCLCFVYDIICVERINAMANEHCLYLWVSSLFRCVRLFLSRTSLALPATAAH